MSELFLLSLKYVTDNVDVRHQEYICMIASFLVHLRVIYMFS